MLQNVAREYLKGHPKAAVINLGCGLDLSFEEIDNGQCKFINMDLPDVIFAREQIVQLREREYNFSGDLMDFDWMEKIQEPPLNVNIADGVFIISGGVLMYFSTEQMKQFFLALAKAFPGGGICFDGENESGVKKIQQNRSENRKRFADTVSHRELQKTVPRLGYLLCRCA